MIVYGVALLSACLLLGLLGGELLGVILGVQANVGGVGIAMLLLVLACNSRKFKMLVEGDSGKGVKFWSAMYIPIIVAMAARQNVVAAVNGGVLALSAGVVAVVACFALVPVISKIGFKTPTDSKLTLKASMEAAIETRSRLLADKIKTISKDKNSPKQPMVEIAKKVESKQIKVSKD